MAASRRGPHPRPLPQEGGVSFLCAININLSLSLNYIAWVVFGVDKDPGGFVINIFNCCRVIPFQVSRKLSRNGCSTFNYFT
jgi:hypothetical protein